MRIKSRLKELAHMHKFTTLIIYPPHSEVCDQPQCKDSNQYDFMLGCDCGYTKLTKLPRKITSILLVGEDLVENHR